MVAFPAAEATPAELQSQVATAQQAAQTALMVGGRRRGAGPDRHRCRHFRAAGWAR
ncbi:MAG TPA: hypothetical protein VFU22_16375 [Roseiflexaceae bacterium]|nr:hypothetical protein [Roseiflexaceae bacterium]